MGLTDIRRGGGALFIDWEQHLLNDADGATMGALVKQQRNDANEKLTGKEGHYLRCLSPGLHLRTQPDPVPTAVCSPRAANAIARR